MREASDLVRCGVQGARAGLPGADARRGSRTELLERFRTLGNAVLVASQSFWEGVDVRGDALSVVVIDRAAVSRRRMIRCWRRASIK